MYHFRGTDEVVSGVDAMRLVLLLRVVVTVVLREKNQYTFQITLCDFMMMPDIFPH